ncbi:hypothetical protein [Actinoplanes sp. NPDC026670]|uniref:hypothetical protein n=1 Tax=Actinoplanes sp. NPDC026670 TaxID=3154700 RepID=UPI0034041CA1
MTVGFNVMPDEEGLQGHGARRDAQHEPAGRRLDGGAGKKFVKMVFRVSVGNHQFTAVLQQMSAPSAPALRIVDRLRLHSWRRGCGTG